MLGMTPTYQEIKDFVTEQDLLAVCTFDTINSRNTFATLTTADGLDMQVSFPTNGPCAKVFIEYSIPDDMFIYRCAYFDESMNPLSREQFAVSYPSPNPATDYYGDKIVSWIRVPTTDKYNLSYATGPGQSWGNMFQTSLPVITKVN